MLVPVIALVLAVAAVLVGLAVSRRLQWAPAGPVVLIAFTPLLPRVNVVIGVGLDDLLPLVGVAMLLPMVLRTGVVAARSDSSRLALLGATIGMGLLIVVGAISSVANGHDPLDALRMVTRSSGRFAFLALIAYGIALAVRQRSGGTLIAARALALMGLAESAFGLFAFFVPLPDRIGLGDTRPWSVLWGEVPGRLSGTLGLSPNFTGAVLMLSLLVTIGLAARPVRGRERIVWLAIALVQLTALTLTFSRAPLGLAILGAVALVLIVSRPILLAPLAALIGLLAILTPIAGRFLSDVTDRLALWYSALLVMLDHPLAGVGPGQMQATMRSNPDRYVDTPLGRAVNNAHNTILLSGAEMGVLGLIASGLLNLSLAAMTVVQLVRVGRRRADAHVVAGAIALAAFLAQGMVNNLFTVGVTSAMGAFVVGAFVLPGLLEPAADQVT